MRLFHESSGIISKCSQLSLVGWYEWETVLVSFCVCDLVDICSLVKREFCDVDSRLRTGLKDDCLTARLL